MTSRAQQLHEPIKLTTLIHTDEVSSATIGIQTLRIPRGFPKSIILKNLNLEFHVYASQRQVHYSIDVIDSLPQGISDGFTPRISLLERLKQIYDLDHVKLIQQGEEGRYGNDTDSLPLIALTAPVQRGVKLLARMNGKVLEHNEYQSKTVDFEELQMKAASGSQDQTAPVASTGLGTSLNPVPPQVTTVDDEFVIVARFACFNGDIRTVSGVISLGIS
ncbi:hypothetical protein TWF481_001708 [Arthrobotrys musiformis]|uniref:Uncharacterized protein n=1 Tax=Arthrobotrys musiformis TaxID=47236 RepID=A0AAV9W055_9PEZI